MTLTEKHPDIVIFNLVQCTVFEILNMHPTANMIHWCNGYFLFLHAINEIEHSRGLIKDNIDYIEEVYYAQCSDKNLKVVNSGNIPLDVADTSNHPLFREIVDYVKEVEY